jgi:hypothetical protein
MRRLVWAMLILTLFATGCAPMGTTGDSQKEDSQKEKERPRGY